MRRVSGCFENAGIAPVDITILSLSTSAWAYPYWTSRQFLMYELARRTRVVYATQRPDLRDFLHPGSRGDKRQRPPFDAPPGMVVARTKWPRTYRFRLLDAAFSSAYRRRLQAHLDSRDGQRVVYAWNPSFVDTVRRLSYDTLVYHPYDMFRHFVDSPDEVVEQESAICDLADAVITPHQKVADALGHPNTHVMNNGVFLPAFPDFRDLQPFEGLREIGRPLIGYVGAINDKIDFALLLDVFSTQTDWNLAFVGFSGPGKWKSSPAFQRISKLSNVHFLDGVPIDQVARAMAGFDVGIVPYSLSGWAGFSESPLKMYQYWAVGVPVLSTPLPNLQPDREALAIGRTPDEWSAAISELLRLRNEAVRARLREKAVAHSWAAKADKVLGLLRGLRQG